MLFTIGYSGFFEIDNFIKVLRENNVSVLVDIRTFPYSRTFPQYNNEKLKTTLKKGNIKHMFLGKYIGGLKIKTLVKNGVSSSEELLEDNDFKEGMRILYKLSKKENLCIMCAEKEPFDCHRLYISYLFYKRTGEQVFNLFPDKREDISKTIKRFKSENKLDKIDIDDEKLISERFKLLYKIQNKREERYPDTYHNLTLFEKN